MQLGGLTGGLYRLSEWIMRFAYLNILWVGFSLIGLFVFGIMPASSSMFSIVRKWQRGETDLPIFKTFWQHYKKDFVKINLIGIVLYIIGSIVYMDIFYMKSVNGFSSILVFAAFCIIAFLYLLLILYIFPTFVHFDLKIPHYFKYSLLFALTNIIGTIIMIGAALATWFLIRVLPASLLFFSMSLLAFVLMWAANLGFSKVTAIQEADDPKTLNNES
ncbi:YesL family protein [Pullulanibacillus sp. KACC 23026]|uniref:YesL family protein n=1 Tax=Pullulanibacillus sp. KACC 23026 TaxID=3028315 RepID=UPI0023B1E65C|nr:YesL family protein [Pullulanibacillus sp. KACC 23026]WEG13707.1 YesL family protein [Pullulanibacillus sp. KACC 23026]